MPAESTACMSGIVASKNVCWFLVRFCIHITLATEYRVNLCHAIHANVHKSATPPIGLAKALTIGRSPEQPRVGNVRILLGQRAPGFEFLSESGHHEHLRPEKHGSLLKPL